VCTNNGNETKELVCIENKKPIGNGNLERHVPDTNNERQNHTSQHRRERKETGKRGNWQGLTGKQEEYCNPKAITTTTPGGGTNEFR
jgi:hypothetical protein